MLTSIYPVRFSADKTDKKIVKVAFVIRPEPKPPELLALPESPRSEANINTSPKSWAAKKWAKFIKAVDVTSFPEISEDEIATRRTAIQAHNTRVSEDYLRQAERYADYKEERQEVVKAIKSSFEQKPLSSKEKVEVQVVNGFAGFKDALKTTGPSENPFAAVITGTTLEDIEGHNLYEAGLRLVKTCNHRNIPVAVLSAGAPKAYENEGLDYESILLNTILGTHLKTVPGWIRYKLTEDNPS